MDPLHAMVDAIIQDELMEELEATGEHGTLTIAELTSTVRTKVGAFLGVDVPVERGEDLVRSIVHAPGPVTLLGDGRVVDLDALIDGVGLPHRVTADEVAGDHLDLLPDLAALSALAEANGGLFDANAAALHLHSTTTRDLGFPVRSHQLQGPPGWLAAHHPGDVVRVTVSDGMVEIVAADDPGAADDVSCGGALSELDAHEPGDIADGTPIDLVRLQAAGLVDGWWSPEHGGACFADVVAGAGLDAMGDHVGLPGSAERLAEMTRLIAPMARSSRLSSTSVEMLAAAITPWVRLAAEGEVELPAPPDGLARALTDDPDLVIRLERELRIAVERRPDGLALVGRHLDALPTPSGRPALGVTALRAQFALATGDVEAAERLARAAATIDPFHYVGTEILATLAGHRGALREVVSLLTSVRTPDDDELVLMRARLRRLEPDVGRNEPCPCGSGRKFKQCHLGRAELDGATTVSWLLDQVREFVLLAAPPNVLAELGDDLPDGDGPELLVFDEVLFGQGWIGRFLEQRGAALSNEHLELVRAWAGESRSGLFRITDLDAGGARFVALDDGEELDVGPSDSLLPAAPGVTVWTRLLPARGRWWTAGICAVLSDQAREAVLASTAELDVDPRAASVARIRAILDGGRPVAPVAADGQPQVSASCHLSHGLDPETLETVLDSRFERRPEEDDGWFGGWIARPAGGAEVRINAPGLSLASSKARAAVESARGEQVEGGLDGGGDLDEGNDPWTDLVILGSSIPSHRAVVDEVEALLAAAGGAPERHVERATPMRRWEAYETHSEMLGAIDRAEYGDPDDGGWWDDDLSTEDDWPDDPGPRALP